MYSCLVIGCSVCDVTRCRTCSGTTCRWLKTGKPSTTEATSRSVLTAKRSWKVQLRRLTWVNCHAKTSKRWASTPTTWPRNRLHENSRLPHAPAARDVASVIAESILTFHCPYTNHLLSCFPFLYSGLQVFTIRFALKIFWKHFQTFAFVMQLLCVLKYSSYMKTRREKGPLSKNHEMELLIGPKWQETDLYVDFGLISLHLLMLLKIEIKNGIIFSFNADSHCEIIDDNF